MAITDHHFFARSNRHILQTISPLNLHGSLVGDVSVPFTPTNSVLFCLCIHIIYMYHKIDLSFIILIVLPSAFSVPCTDTLQHYHEHCFTCLECHCVLRKGHYYGLYQKQVYCEHHFMMATTAINKTIETHHEWIDYNNRSTCDLFQQSQQSMQMIDQSGSAQCEPSSKLSVITVVCQCGGNRCVKIISCIVDRAGYVCVCRGARLICHLAV